MKIWRLKKGGDIRFRQGHPWIFSGELAHSSRDVEPGEAVELRDASDHFLAYGMAHPSSNICFRKLSGRSKETDVLSVDFFLRRFEQARQLRASVGWDQFSHRWIFAEADGLPGLVADVFKGEEELTVFQVSTAGMERAKDDLLTALEKFGKHMCLEASTSSQRKVEGLTPVSRNEFGVAAADLEDFSISLKHLERTIHLRANFASGQKTGFFLDQQWNSNLLLSLAAPECKPGRALRVLDLCCYVGQWTAQLAFLAKHLSCDLKADLVDVSEEALRLAKTNVERHGAEAHSFAFDVMEGWPGEIGEQQYDVVICDPPAFVKKKADLSKAISGYVKLNREAIRRVRPGGLFVSCSCSGAVREDDFFNCLNAAKTKAGRMIRWQAKGGHAPDHPVLSEFPEGQYLKCWIGTVDFPF